MQSKTIIGLALATVISLTAGAQITNQNVRSLSLKESLDLALAHNLDVQIERYTPEIARYYLRAGYGAYDPTLNLTAKRTFVDQPPQFDPKKYQFARFDAEYELTVDTLGPGLIGRLPTGLSYELFARADHLDASTFPSIDVTNLPAPLHLTNDYYATVGVNLRQPLLKDFWIDQYRRNIQLNKKNLKITEIAFRGQIMSNITTVATVYYELVFAREQVNVENSALELARRLLDDTHRKVQAGTETALAEKQAESDVETIRTALFTAEQRYSEEENVLKDLLTDNFESWMDVRIIPSEGLTNVTELPANRAVSWVNALSRRPDVLEARLALEKQDIVLRFNYNQLFPSLDLVGSYGWQAVEHRFGGAWDDLKDGKNPFYSVAVVVSFPWGNTTARNDYKASQLAKKQALLRYKKLEQSVITQVENAVKLTETTYKQIASTRTGRKFAEDALDAVQREYEAGTKTSYFVLEYQRNLTRARSAEIRALADYNIALAQLALKEGTTLERNKIDLKIK